MPDSVEVKGRVCLIQKNYNVFFRLINKSIFLICLCGRLRLRDSCLRLRVRFLRMDGFRCQTMSGCWRKKSVLVQTDGFPS